jgi:ATP-dependent DNA helicase PIF1
MKRAAAPVRIPSPRKVTPTLKAKKTDRPVQELSDQQRDILTRVLSGESFFYTGSAGTGKSVLLRAIIAAFRERQAAWYEEARYVPPGVDVSENRWQLAVTASTGMAAV